MSTQSEYIICVCQNAECRMRFPALFSTAAHMKCPSCGSLALPANEIFTNKKPVTEPTPTENKIKIHVALDNLRSAFNVGSVFRTADAARIDHLHLYGITPTPENPKVEKTSLGSEYAVPWSHHKNGLEHLQTIKPHFHILALEGGQNAISLFDLDRRELPPAVLLLLGSEFSGLDPALMRLADQIVYIPMIGFKRSLNVASAFSISAYFLRFIIQ